MSLARHLTGFDETALVELEQRHRLLPDVKAAYQRMKQAAALDGIELALVSSYRSFSQQARIWTAKYTGQRPVYNKAQQQVDIHTLNGFAKIEAILLYSALPGASRHHWGTDLDLFDKAAVAENYQVQLLDAEYQSGGPFYALDQWLSQHAAQFGFFRPYQRDQGGVAKEAWHLSYRPLAEGYLNSFDEAMLSDAIAQSELPDKTLLLEHIPLIFKRYVCTICKD
ncbi:M15 family metallopeptidase [Rheinheimera sp.]|jgi:LAS superfamily LD-carboxypeptidase LdcB|uniref:M15 family metallopeptidase n=1 Tax=Rheinheimera sp. TaxID=1869214 RepID=UPI00262F8247|nr:M15 family metallopeptidase [Rheinheimera sp.]MCA1929824.1 M15 family metallopeptidase [Rheinheimera sp.]